MAETQKRTADFISNEAKNRLPWNSGDGLWVKTDNFIAQSQIIREEALFQAIDSIVHDTKGVSIPRRKSLRLLIDNIQIVNIQKGKNTAGDLGPVRLEMNEDKIHVKQTAKKKSESGFCMLIEIPGSYILKGVKITVEYPADNAEFNKNKKNCFFACLPLVLRKWESKDYIQKTGQKRRVSDIFIDEADTGYNFITALDIEGNAAFIAVNRNKKVFLFPRDETPHFTGYRVLVENRFNGGTDV